jgi:Ni/Co efflux regulator RcnB
MKHVLTVCAALVLVAPWWVDAEAQSHGPQKQRCEPGNLHCTPGPGMHGRGNEMKHQRMQQPAPVRESYRRDRDRWQDDQQEERHNSWLVPDLRRGDRVPPAYGGYQYVVEDWQGHGLRRPPRGHHWVQVGPDYVLVAVTTGIIMELLLSH